MSGPIIRKYGFPNFDQIFGQQEPAHGVETPAQAPEDDAPPPPTDPESPDPADPVEGPPSERHDDDDEE